MPSFKLFVGMTLVLGLAACGGGNAGNDAGHDTGVANHDTGVTNQDTGVTHTDSGMTGTDGGAVTYGQCGMTVDNCICACAATDTSCPQNCVNAEPSPYNCGVCILRAQSGTSCCPTEGQAYITCAQNAQGDGGACASPDASATCVDMTCSAQAAAFQSCLDTQFGADGGTPNMACETAVNSCFGNALDSCM